MKKRVWQRNITGSPAIIPLCALLCIAFCTSALGTSLDDIKDPGIKSYTNGELRVRAPALNLSSRLLYGEAMRTLKEGNWKEAREKLLLANDFSSDYAAPSYALARISLKQGDFDFIIYLLSGLKRQSSSFYKRNLLLINLIITLTAAAGMTLLIYLILLLIKYSSEINHKITEIYSGRFTFPPAKYIGPVIIAGLLLIRPGLAAYAALLIIVVWSFTSNMEKGILISLVVLISISSFYSEKMNNFVPGLDEYSVTRRLSLINEKGADKETIGLIEEIDSPEFTAEINFALGTLMYRKGNLHAAKRYLRQSIAENGDFVEAFINLGNIYFKEGDHDKALNGYRNAVSLDSTNSVAHYNIGQTCIKNMRFSLSSSALTKASEFGIERYKRENPASAFADNEILDCGFKKSHLRSIAAREAENRKLVLIDEVFRSLILMPFNVLWILFPMSVLAAIFIKKALPEEWEVFNCDNCDKPVCQNCAKTELGINLCPDCGSMINGLSSVKVTEALLRRKRQKAIKRISSSGWKRMLIFPGGTHIYTKKTFTGVLMIFISSIALLSLIWNGFYFKDPRYEFTSPVLWKTIVSLIILTITAIISTRVKKPGINRNYNILPPQTLVEQNEEEDKTDYDENNRSGEIAIENSKEKEEFFDSFMDAL
ncbi:MAG TPA: tetratricopeptide repeat protein [Candidatus Krumholzibacteriaceae bacterium]|nr:tetratricopeptide repeat protein [Candidatus Krumholzibacteriaceae bacterium]